MKSFNGELLLCGEYSKTKKKDYFFAKFNNKLLLIFLADKLINIISLKVFFFPEIENSLKKMYALFLSGTNFIVVILFFNYCTVVFFCFLYFTGHFFFYFMFIFLTKPRKNHKLTYFSTFFLILSITR